MAIVAAMAMARRARLGSRWGKAWLNGEMLLGVRLMLRVTLRLERARSARRWWLYGSAILDASDFRDRPRRIIAPAARRRVGRMTRVPAIGYQLPARTAGRATVCSFM